MTPQDRRRAARRRQERAAPELREPAVRHGRHRARRDAVSRRAIRITGRSSATCRTSPPRATTTWWRSSRSTTRRRTRAWSSPATSTRRRRARWSRSGSATSSPAPRAEPMTIPGVALTGVQKKTITDRVQLPRLYLAWLTPRALRARRRRARRRRRRAGRRQELAALQAARLRHADRAGRQRVPGVAGAVVVRSRSSPRRGPGHTVDELQKVIDEEIAKLQREAPTDARGRARRSTRSRRRSTTGWSASAASAARPIS